MTAASSPTWRCQAWATSRSLWAQNYLFIFLSQNKAILVSGSYHLPRQNALLTSAARGRRQPQHSSRFLCWREISLHEDSLKWIFAMLADAQGNALERTDNEEILSFTQRGHQKLCKWLRADK